MQRRIGFDPKHSQAGYFVCFNSSVRLMLQALGCFLSLFATLSRHTRQTHEITPIKTAVVALPICILEVFGTRTTSIEVSQKDCGFISFNTSHGNNNFFQAFQVQST